MGMLSKLANRLKEEKELIDMNASGGYSNPSLLTDDEDRIKAAEGGDIEIVVMGEPEIMEDPEAEPMEEELIPDEEMEENYVDFIISQSLSEEDQEFLNKELEGNDKLSVIFDQVIEAASEFSGEGPVDGPGTGVSDSIPARLSDGEFVFTAKATEEIGEDRLMSMMKEAEARADGRQDMANGGMVMEEEPIFRPQPQPTQQDIRVTKETVGAQASMREEEDLIGNELKKSMLSTAPYVRS